ncbi:2,3-bisphosphoglycerate-independent phosphoglycerate mutase-like [Bolinopsis microptera]|uniref:2,3-bisphosphoglycerate-independent phosphoglycerate mutase-like n=1 Tax=Bolinopsis microptera TaxID=2820187 RepID=UPI003078A806
MSSGKEVCLIVIDGWGISENTDGNAIHAARTPVMDEMSIGDKALTLNASGLAVGLPDGLMGNSEVGHLNIGAGRVVYQDIVAINLAFEKNTVLNNRALIDAAKRPAKKIHLLGLVSDGGVHSHIDHVKGLLSALKELGAPPAFLHFFSDGRDTKPTSGVTYMTQMLEFIDGLEYGSLATVTGRYYAMDRDKRHERIKLAYEGMVQGIGDKVAPANLTIFVEEQYKQGVTDEFLKPIIVNDQGLIGDGDTLFFIDFRSDRMRQITEAFGVQRHFETAVVPKDISITTLTKYKEDFPFPVLFPPRSNEDTLAEWLSKKQINHFHCAETEKYAHVTFFFNGGVEKQWETEHRKLVPSPKVATYDLQPTMNAAGVAREMVAAIRTGSYPLVMCNFAPPDMVGHTGKYEATVTACEETDRCIGEIRSACRVQGYTLLVTSDHGNAEQMYSETGGPHTAHTCNRVPFYMDGGSKTFRSEVTSDPALCDVAPTILRLMGVSQPEAMTGDSLVD